MATVSETEPNSQSNLEKTKESAHDDNHETETAVDPVALSTAAADTEWRRDEIDESTHEDTFVKKKLMYHLQTRPAREQLVNLNILKAFGQDASLRAVMDNLMKQRLRMLLSSRILDAKLSNRKSIQSLIRKGILKEADDDNEEEEDEKGNRRDMYRRMSQHSLTEFLSQRPTLQELVKANMVQDVMTWTKITCTGTIPRERNCHQMCLNRDHSALYLLGGFNTGSVCLDLLKFDIEDQKWMRPLVGGPVPPERYCHTVVNVDSNLVVFGGFSVEGKWLNDLHALDTEYAMNSEFKAYVPTLSAYGQCKASTNNSQMLLWYPPETTGHPPSPRAAHAACVVGKKMYVFGGNNYNKLFNDMHCLDTATMKWSQLDTQAQAPSPRANHSLTAVGDKYLIVFGGNDGQPLSDVHIFDIEKNVWQQPKINGTPPIARGGHTAVCMKNKQLLIFAGGYNNKILNDLHILDVETMTWIRPSDTGMLPEPRAGHSCCVTKNNVVYVCGGGDSENDKLFNDLYQLDTGYFTTDEKQISKLIYATKDHPHYSAAISASAGGGGGGSGGGAHARKSASASSSLTRKHWKTGGGGGHHHHHGQLSRTGPHAQHPRVHAMGGVERSKSTSPLSPPASHVTPRMWTMNHASYEYYNGRFSQSHFQNNLEHFASNLDAQYGGGNDADSPLKAAGVISDDIANISQEIDDIIQSVEDGIKHKINEFKAKEQAYIMMLRSIEAERSKLSDNVNRDMTTLKFAVKESLDKLQQKFIARSLRHHLEFLNAEPPAPGHAAHKPIASQTETPPTATLTQTQATTQHSPKPPETNDESKPNVDTDAPTDASSERNDSNDSDKNTANTKPPPMTKSKAGFPTSTSALHAIEEEAPARKPQAAAAPPPQAHSDGDANTNMIASTGTTSVNGNRTRSQSPNPTQSAIPQAMEHAGTTPMITAALSQQALSQQALCQQAMMARQLIKIQEQHRKQKLQQITEHAQQMYLQINTNCSNNGNNQNNGNSNNSNRNQQWWQRGAQPYGTSQYPPMPQSPQSSGDQASGGKFKKKRRRKKKKIADATAPTLTPQLQSISMEATDYNLASLPAPFLNGNANLPLFNNGIGNGLNAAGLYLNNAHLPAVPAPAPPFTAQNGATPNLSVLNTLHGNTVNYNSANSM